MIKERVESTPSNSSPENAPAWAVRDGYQQRDDNSNEEIIPSANPSTATPATSRPSEVTRPRRLLGEKDLNQVLDDSDSFSSSDETEA